MLLLVRAGKIVNIQQRYSLIHSLMEGYAGCYPRTKENSNSQIGIGWAGRFLTISLEPGRCMYEGVGGRDLRACSAMEEPDEISQWDLIPTQ